MPLTFIVGSVPHIMRLRTASSAMPSGEAAWATVRRWFVYPARSHTQDTRPLGSGPKAFEAVPVPVVYVSVFEACTM